jgi:hypothetical protein
MLSLVHHSWRALKATAVLSLIWLLLTLPAAAGAAAEDAAPHDELLPPVGSALVEVGPEPLERRRRPM